MSQTHRYVLGAILWVVALMLMIFGSVDRDRFVALWSVLAALAACFICGWALMEYCAASMMAAMDAREEKIDRLIAAILGELGDGDRPTFLRR